MASASRFKMLHDAYAVVMGACYDKRLMLSLASGVNFDQTNSSVPSLHTSSMMQWLIAEGCPYCACWQDVHMITGPHVNIYRVQVHAV